MICIKLGPCLKIWTRRIFGLRKQSHKKISPKYYPLNICSPNIIITVCRRICFQKKHPLEIQRFQGLNILIFVAAGLECHLWQMPGISKLFRRRVVLPGNSLMGCDESGVVAMALFFFLGGGGRNSSGKRTTWIVRHIPWIPGQCL